MHNLLPEDRKRDTVILAVSPEAPEQLAQVIPKVKARTGREFSITLLSDADHKVIARYGLLNEGAAKQNNFLPHPATFLIDAEGIVRWRHVDKDYKVRPTNEELRKELQKSTGQPANRTTGL